MLRELIAAAYRVDLDRSAHLREVLLAATNFFGSTGKVAAWSFRHAPDLTTTETNIVTSPGSEDLSDLLRTCEQMLTPLARVALMSRPSVRTSLDVHGLRRARLLALQHQLIDDTTLVCPASNMTGIVVGATFDHPRRYSRSERLGLGLAAWHLAAGWKLRTALEERSSEVGIFTPQGRHLHGKVREPYRGALRDAVVRRERLRCHAAGTENIWQELLDGKWTLADRFEADGKRYVVATHNSEQPQVPFMHSDARRALTMAVAGVPNKIIALELGLQESRVTRVIEQALQTVRLLGLKEALMLATNAPVRLAEGKLDLSVWEVAPLDSRLRHRLDKLSEAERAVVLGVVDGRRRVEIARGRDTSVKTIDNQLKSAFSKLGVSSRRELLLFAARP